MQGLTASTFGPDQNLTREEMALLLARALRLMGSAALSFSDAGQIAPWAQGAVAAAVAAGFLSGLPGGTFQPLAAATRARRRPRCSPWCCACGAVTALRSDQTGCGANGPAEIFGTFQRRRALGAHLCTA